MLKKILGLMTAALIVLGLVSSCGRPAEGRTVSQDGSTEMVALTENDFYVLTGNENIKKGDLLTLSWPQGQAPAVPGAVYKIKLKGALRESWPPQGDAETAEKLKDDAGVISLSWTAADAIRSFLPKKTFLIDVRTPAEYQSGYVKGAVNCELQRLKSDLPGLLADPNDLVIVYCRSGNRSASAAKEIKAMGYKLVFDAGGINSYKGELVKP